MKVIAHRINKIKDLIALPPEFGVEIDVRGWGKDLVLNHEPFEPGDQLEEYLRACDPRRLVVFNVKEAGIESRVHELAAQCQIKNYFLLDVEFPYLYRAAREGEKRIAVRYSEDESIETVLKYKHLVDWVWIDTNTKLPLDATVAKQLEGFKLCLVCPERWGRPGDIKSYRLRLSELGIKLDAVMTSTKLADQWR
jgi:hypothetical protein